MGLHYYHMMLEFREMNSFLRVFFRVLLFGKYFFGFSVNCKVFLGLFRNTQLALTRWLTDPISVTKFYHYEFFYSGPHN